MNLARIAAMSRAESRVAARDGEQLLITLGLPVGLLVFFSLVDILPTSGVSAVNFLAPGILALALLSVAFVRSAIGLGFDKRFGAIRRLAVTPLTEAEFLASRMMTTLLVFAVQLVVLTAVAIGLGWRPQPSPLFVVATLLGLVAFSGLAFALVGLVDGLASLAAANAIYVVLLLLSGLIFGLDSFPGGLATAVKALPSTALASLFRDTLSGASGQTWAWLCLLGWAVAAPLVGLKLFKWD